MAYAVQDQQGNGSYLSVEATDSFDILGIITPVTSDPDKILTFDNEEEAQKYADKCNLSPYSKYQVIPTK
jgi:hypothetical protein